MHHAHHIFSLVSENKISNVQQYRIRLKENHTSSVRERDDDAKITLDLLKGITDSIE
jgi:hypothetical protein